MINQFHPDDGWQSSNHYQTTISGFYKLGLVSSLSQDDIPQPAHNSNIQGYSKTLQYWNVTGVKDVRDDAIMEWQRQHPLLLTTLMSVERNYLTVDQ